MERSQRIGDNGFFPCKKKCDDCTVKCLWFRYQDSDCYYCKKPNSDFWFSKQYNGREVNYSICDKCREINDPKSIVK